jgi:hypothetical protein
LIGAHVRFDSFETYSSETPRGKELKTIKNDELFSVLTMRGSSVFSFMKVHWFLARESGHNSSFLIVIGCEQIDRIAYHDQMG